jgi:type II secretory pathway pseudopilin PulG
MRPLPQSARSAYTLIELVIVGIIISILCVVLLPKLLAARLNANESSAIATMRALSTAEIQVLARNSIDTDGDGAGEEGYFAELAGTAAMRTNVGGAPGIGATRMDPVVLSTALGIVNSQGLVSHSGYFFQIWLPSMPSGGVTGAIGERPTVGGATPGNLPDSDQSEYFWCAYAWPMNARQTGNRAFFINQHGELLQCDNHMLAPYTNTAKIPAFDEAFTTAGDISSAPRVGIAGGHDGSVWVPVQ